MRAFRFSLEKLKNADRSGLDEKELAKLDKKIKENITREKYMEKERMQFLICKLSDIDKYQIFLSKLRFIKFMIILIQKSLFECYDYRLTFSHKRKFYNKLKVETLTKAL